MNNKKAIAVGDRFFYFRDDFHRHGDRYKFFIACNFLSIQSQTRYCLLGLVFNYAQLLSLISQLLSKSIYAATTKSFEFTFMLSVFALSVNLWVATQLKLDRAAVGGDRLH